jgi:hypothetical protein
VNFLFFLAFLLVLEIFRFGSMFVIAGVVAGFVSSCLREFLIQPLIVFEDSCCPCFFFFERTCFISR